MSTQNAIRQMEHIVLQDPSITNVKITHLSSSSSSSSSSHWMTALTVSPNADPTAVVSSARKTLRKTFSFPPASSTTNTPHRNNSNRGYNNGDSPAAQVPRSWHVMSSLPLMPDGSGRVDEDALRVVLAQHYQQREEDKERQGDARRTIRRGHSSGVGLGRNFTTGAAAIF